jgi:hypothetical protein
VLVIDPDSNGWLRWQFQITELRDDSFTLHVCGDFVGCGILTFVQD